MLWAHLPFAKTGGKFRKEAHAARMRRITGGSTCTGIFQRRVVSCPGLTYKNKQNSISYKA